MPSYAVVGASRGIGLEFVRQLSSKSENTVFAIARNVNSSAELTALAESAENVQIVQGDLVDNESLKSAAKEVGARTGGSLDYLINNGASIITNLEQSKLTDYIGHEDQLHKDFNTSFQTNVIGVIQTINAFIPLLQKGTTKKVIALSTGLADIEFNLAADFAPHVPYAASKLALNMVIAKYAIQFRPEGFTFLAISPGVVNTVSALPTPAELENIMIMIAKFQKAEPSWNGQPITPTESVQTMLKTIERFTPAESGSFVSHHGTKTWL